MILISWETLPKESQFPYKLRIRSWNSLLHRYLLNIQNFLCKSLTIFHFSLRFAEIGNSQKLLNIFSKCSILDVWQGSEYPSETYDHSTSWIVSVFGVFLVLIFQYLYWIQRDTKYLLESYPLGKRMIITTSRQIAPRVSLLQISEYSTINTVFGRESEKNSRQP